jgi:hypothetical protein
MFEASHHRSIAELSAPLIFKPAFMSFIESTEAAMLRHLRALHAGAKVSMSEAALHAGVMLSHGLEKFEQLGQTRPRCGLLLGLSTLLIPARPAVHLSKSAAHFGAVIFARAWAKAAWPAPERAGAVHRSKTARAMRAAAGVGGGKSSKMRA